MAERNIIQLMPSQHWAAVFIENDEEFYEPLIGWALVEEASKRSVVGLVAGDAVTFCDTMENFHGYIHLASLMPEDMAMEMNADDFLDDDDGDDMPPPTYGNKPSRLN